MSRVLLGGAAVAAACATACSLLVSTSGFSGGGSDGGVDAAFSPAEAGVADAGPGGPGGPGGPDAGADGEAGAPGDPDLLGAWSFDETVGTTAHDASGKGNDGALDRALFVPDGVSGGAVTLDEDAKVRMATLDGAKFPKNGTISLWLRHSFTVSDGDRDVFDGWDKSRSHLFLRRPGGEVADHFQVALQPTDPTGTGQYVYASSFETPPGVWTHVVITWSEESRAGALYVGGTLIALRPYNADFEPSGQSFTLGGGFIGELDEVRLYTRALSAAEVAALP